MVELHWCPGHAGIHGNERVDRIAGNARKVAQHLLVDAANWIGVVVPMNLGNEVSEFEHLLYSHLTNLQPQKGENSANPIMYLMKKQPTTNQESNHEPEIKTSRERQEWQDA